MDCLPEEFAEKYFYMKYVVDMSRYNILWDVFFVIRQIKQPKIEFVGELD